MYKLDELTKKGIDVIFKCSFCGEEFEFPSEAEDHIDKICDQVDLNDFNDVKGEKNEIN